MTDLSSVPNETNGPDNPDRSDGPDDLVGPSWANNLDGLGQAGSTKLMGITGSYTPSGLLGLSGSTQPILSGFLGPIESSGRTDSFGSSSPFPNLL